MKRLGLCVLAVAACGKKDPGAGSSGGMALSSEPGSAAGSDLTGSATTDASADATLPASGSAAEGSGSGSGSGSAGGNATYVIEVAADNTVTMQLGRAWDHAGDPIKASVKFPAGWRAKPEPSHAITFILDGTKYDRPNIIVQIVDDVRPDTKDDPKKLARKRIDKMKQVEVGGGKIKVLTSKDLPNGFLLTRAIDAEKERDITYQSTVCDIHDAKYKTVLEIEAFADKDFETMIPAFEEICTTVKILD